jgi:D-alanyl-D-alanine carboxypeptidase
MNYFYPTRIIVLFALFTFSSLQAQVPQDLEIKLKKTLDSMQKQLNMKSLSVALQLKDNAIWSGASGISSQTPLVNAKSDDLYLIGSVTKTLTSACVLQMCDEKIIGLEDTIGKFLDSLPNINPSITLRQLLRHQSGIFDVLNNSGFNFYLLNKESSLVKPDELIRRFSLPAIDRPGGAWAYCNTNYFILGMIIEKVTGKPFYTEIRKRFFTPLGLNSFAFPSYEAMPSNVAHVWIDLNGDGFVEDAHTFYQNYRALNSMAGASGGYYCSASDLSKWMRKYMRGDLLSKMMMNEAQTMVFASGTPGQKYGLGMMRAVFNGMEAFGHGGDLSYSAQSWYFPLKDLSISVLNNDSRFNSWTLLPVITALHKTYCDWQMTVGLKDVESKDLKLFAYPNPFIQNINTTLKSNESIDSYDLKILNCEGKIMKQAKIKARDTLAFEDVSSWANGLYVAVLSKNGLMVDSVPITKQ